ncbi:MAG: hypothetical protein ABI442_00505 [Gemmatimonadaceae bacterium]
MRNLLNMRGVVLAVALGSVGACARNPRPRVGVEYAVRQPPSERVEVIPDRPGAEYVWVKGHWGWRRNDYEWIPGRWSVPARGFREWLPGRWERDRYGWFYVEGRWR